MFSSKRLKLCMSFFAEDDSTAACLTIASLACNRAALPTRLSLLMNEDHVRIPLFYEKWIDLYLDSDFFSNFRMRRISFDKLYDEIAAIYREPKYRGGYYPILLEKQLLIMLWYLAKGETMSSIGDKFNVAVSTVFDCVSPVITLINNLDSKYIMWPNQYECIDIEATFRKHGGYPGVFGAIDGCHFRCKIPLAQHDSYQDRKFQHSISMQGICDARMMYRNISVGYPGSVHDARILKESNIYKCIKDNGPDSLFYYKYHILGDSAYSCRIWLITPYKDNGRLTREQRRHNYVLRKTRVKIENSFGRLKGCWRILEYINVYSVKRATNIIKVCCILHNFYISCKEEVTEVYEEDEVEEIPREDIDTPGNEKRNQICDILSL